MLAFDNMVPLSIPELSGVLPDHYVGRPRKDAMIRARMMRSLGAEVVLVDQCEVRL